MNSFFNGSIGACFIVSVNWSDLYDLTPYCDKMDKKYQDV